ncbi:MAG: hypothetical protein JSS20_16540, partial [Proteobacteria bacterium]|nr:hypothetical protein [Pseudomonadota bacterium]
MKLKTLLLGIGLALAAAAPAAAQGRASWEFLGEERVGVGNDHDIIRLNYKDDFYRSKSYRRLRFVASGGELKMKAI